MDFQVDPDFAQFAHTPAIILAQLKELYDAKQNFYYIPVDKVPELLKTHKPITQQEINNFQKELDTKGLDLFQ